MVQMVREGTETGYLPNSSDFIKEFEVSRRTMARDSQRREGTRAQSKPRVHGHRGPGGREPSGTSLRRQRVPLRRWNIPGGLAGAMRRWPSTSATVVEAHSKCDNAPSNKLRAEMTNDAT